LESAARNAVYSSEGHVKVLIDLARLTKLQFQHAFLGSVADAGDAAGLYRNSLHSRIERFPGALSPWMRMTSRKELAHLSRRSQPDANTFIHCAEDRENSSHAHK
jgi:hypothetical protein